MRKKLPNILLILIFVTGLSLLLYPSVANWWNTRNFVDAVNEYEAVMAKVDDNTYRDIMSAAHAYNESHRNRGIASKLSEEELEEYNLQLSVDGDPMMGYIRIPVINVSLPIYHGTSDLVLSSGIGHLEWSSLPVGGEGTHCVLSGHRGLPSAKLFSDLDKVTSGDIFTLNIMGETYTYEVDQIRIVLPENMDSLGITPGRDYCTLVTCTPYGVNTHRLLIRGRRTENLMGAEEVRVTADAFRVENIYVAMILAGIILGILLIWLVISSSIQGKRKKARGNEP